MELFLPMCAFTDLKSNPKSFIQIRYVQSFFMGSTNGWARYKKLCTLQGLSPISDYCYRKFINWSLPFIQLTYEDDKKKIKKEVACLARTAEHDDVYADSYALEHFRGNAARALAIIISAGVVQLPELDQADDDGRSMLNIEKPI